VPSIVIEIASRPNARENDTIPAWHHRPIILSSGGLDSTTCLPSPDTRASGRSIRSRSITASGTDTSWRRSGGWRRRLEWPQHRVITIDLRQFGRSALTDDIAVPKDRDESRMSAEIPVTYVPARNTIFLSYSLAWAEVLGVMDVFIV